MRMRKMSGRGDETVAEWDAATSPERLAEIEREFNGMVRSGYFAADVKKEEIIQAFDPAADILMIPRMQGGA